MKLDVNCVRDVLLEFEEFPMGSHPFSAFKKSIAKYGSDNVLYTLYKLREAKFIHADIEADESGFPHCEAVYCIAYRGHEFLDSIRPSGIWDQISSAAGEGGTACLRVVSDIAVEIAKELLRKQFGLPQGK